MLLFEVGGCSASPPPTTNFENEQGHLFSMLVAVPCHHYPPSTSKMSALARFQQFNIHFLDIHVFTLLIHVFKLIYNINFLFYYLGQGQADPGPELAEVGPALKGQGQGWQNMVWPWPSPACGQCMQNRQS